jgi:hypothetical protein
MRIVAKKKYHPILSSSFESSSWPALHVSDRPEKRINRPTRDVHQLNDRLRYNTYGNQRQPIVERRWRKHETLNVSGLLPLFCQLNDLHEFGSSSFHG